MPVHNNVCTKEPVEVWKNPSRGSFEFRIYFRAATRWPMRFLLLGRSALRNPFRWAIVRLSWVMTLSLQTCSKSPRKVCRNVAVSVPRTVARRVCYGGRKGRYWETEKQKTTGSLFYFSEANIFLLETVLSFVLNICIWANPVTFTPLTTATGLRTWRLWNYWITQILY